MFVLLEHSLSINIMDRTMILKVDLAILYCDVSTSIGHFQTENIYNQFGTIKIGNYFLEQWNDDDKTYLMNKRLSTHTKTHTKHITCKTPTKATPTTRTCQHLHISADTEQIKYTLTLKLCTKDGRSAYC